MWLDAPVRDGGRLTLRHTIGWAGCIWLALLAAWGDHSALTGSVEPSVALAKAVHLLGVATWVGSLGAAIVSNRRADMRAAIVSVQGPAFLGAALAVSSGLLLSSRLIVSLTALLSSQYGVLLVVKLGIAVVAVGMGLAARRRRESRWRAELALLGVVVAVGAAMATSSPPIDRAFLADDQPDVRTWSVDADDLLVQTQAIPGRPGTNSVRVHISDTRRPAPAPLVFATLRTPDGSVHRAAIEDGLAFFDGVELANGESGLQLDIERDDWPLTTADVSIDVQPAAYHFPVRLSAEAIGPALRATGYVGVGAALAVIWTPMSVRSRRRALVEGTTCDEDSEPSLR
jgi:copper transport protein